MATPSPTPTVDPCIYKSVTLAVGEQFNLPPGATLVGSSDSTAFTSNCPIPPLEESACFIFAIPVAGEDGNQSQYWEPTGTTNSTTNLLGWELNGVRSNFTTQKATIGNGNFLTSDIADAIADMVAAGVPILNANYGYGQDPYRGTLNFIVIKTFPSIANALQLIMYVDGPIINDSSSVAWFRCESATTYNQGRDGFPGCPA